LPFVILVRVLKRNTILSRVELQTTTPVSTDGYAG
jgi:hypothetical protein